MGYVVGIALSMRGAGLSNVVLIVLIFVMGTLNLSFFLFFFFNIANDF